MSIRRSRRAGEDLGAFRGGCCCGLIRGSRYAHGRQLSTMYGELLFGVWRKMR